MLVVLCLAAVAQGTFTDAHGCFAHRSNLQVDACRANMQESDLLVPGHCQTQPLEEETAHPIPSKPKTEKNLLRHASKHAPVSKQHRAHSPKWIQYCK